MVSLALLPLRERPGDILPLAKHFLKIYRQRLPHGPTALSPCAEEALISHPWQGNIRELENVVHHSLLLCRNQTITVQDLRLSQLRSRRPDCSAQQSATHTTRDLLQRAFRELFEEEPGALHETVEDALLRSAYEFCHHNQVHTAKLLGLSRNVTRTRLIKLGALSVNTRRVEADALAY